MDYKSVASIGTILIVMIIGATYLSGSDYQKILNDYPEKDIFMLTNLPSRVEVLARSSDAAIPYIKWEYANDTAITYAGASQIDKSYWEIYQGSTKLSYKKIDQTTYSYDSDTAKIVQSADYYSDGGYMTKIGTVVREIEIYPMFNKETARWTPVGQATKYSLRWIHETSDAKASTNLNLSRADLGKMQISWEDSADQLSSATSYDNGKIRVNYKSVSGYQEIDPQTKVGSYAIDYSLITSPIDGVAYTPQCLVDCHLPVNISLNKNLTISDLSKFELLLEKASANSGGIYKTGFRILTNVTYTEKESYANGSIQRSLVEANGTRYWNESTYGTRTVQRWKNEWRDFSPTGKTIAANKNYVIDFYGKRKPSLSKQSVDAVPKIGGMSLPYAWWDNDWSYSRTIGLPLSDANQYIKFWVNGTDGHVANCTKEIRITDNASTPNEIPSFIEVDDVSGDNYSCYILTNMSVNGSVYYGNAAAVAPDYSSKLLFADDFLSAGGYYPLEMWNQSAVTLRASDFQANTGGAGASPAWTIATNRSVTRGNYYNEPNKVYWINVTEAEDGRNSFIIWFNINDTMLGGEKVTTSFKNAMGIRITTGGKTQYLIDSDANNIATFTTAWNLPTTFQVLINVSENSTGLQTDCWFNNGTEWSTAGGKAYYTFGTTPKNGGTLGFTMHDDKPWYIDKVKIWKGTSLADAPAVTWTATRPVIELGPETEGTQLTLILPANTTYASRYVEVNATSSTGDLNYSLNDGANQSICTACTFGNATMTALAGANKVTVYLDAVLSETEYFTVTQNPIMAWQYAQIENYTNTGITYNLTIDVYNNYTGTLTNIVVTPDSKFGGPYTIASLASKATNKTVLSKVEARGVLDAWYYINASTLEIGATGSTDPIQIMNPIDPPSKLGQAFSWSNNSSSTPAMYVPGITSQFNITWNGSTTIYIEGNWSGTPTNYTMTELDGNVYIYNDTLPAGGHYWKSYAPLGTQNVSDTWDFTITPNGNISIHLYLNGSEDDLAVYVPGTTANLTLTSNMSACLNSNLTGFVEICNHIEYGNYTLVAQPSQYTNESAAGLARTKPVNCNETYRAWDNNWATHVQPCGYLFGGANDTWIDHNYTIPADTVALQIKAGYESSEGISPETQCYNYSGSDWISIGNSADGNNTFSVPVACWNESVQNTTVMLKFEILATGGWFPDNSLFQDSEAIWTIQNASNTTGYSTIYNMTDFGSTGAGYSVTGANANYTPAAVHYVTVYENHPPTYWNITNSTPILYQPTTFSWFNVTWLDDLDNPSVNATLAKFESNVTGSWANATPVGEGNVSYYKVIVGAGTYQWKMHLSDKYGLSNVTPLQTIYIGKGPALMHLYLNGTEGDRDYFVNTSANLTAQLNTTETIPVNITTNLTVWGGGGGLFKTVSGNNPFTNYTTVGSSQGNFNITAWGGAVNWTITPAAWILKVKSSIVSFPSGTTKYSVNATSQTGDFGIKNQTNLVPIFNATNWGYSSINVSVKLNTTAPACFQNIYLSTNNTFETTDYNITSNTSWTEVVNNLTYLASQGLWSQVTYNNCPPGTLYTWKWLWNISY